AGWRGEPFLGVKLQDPTWTRARWEQAQAELTQWRLRQAQARRQGSDLEPLAVPWGDGEDTKAAAGEETDDESQAGTGPEGGPHARARRTPRATAPDLTTTGPRATRLTTGPGWRAFSSSASRRWRPMPMIRSGHPCR